MKTVVLDEQEKVEEIISRCDICYVGMVDSEN